MCPWASRPRVIRSRELVLCFLYLEMETKFWAFQTWQWADEAVLGALKQKKRLGRLGKGFLGMGGGLEQRPSPGVWAQQLRLTHLLLSRGAAVGGKVLGSRQAGGGQGAETPA